MLGLHVNPQLSDARCHVVTLQARRLVPLLMHPAHVVLEKVLALGHVAANITDVLSVAVH